MDILSRFRYANLFGRMHRYVVICLTTLLVCHASATPLSLTQVPLFLGSSVEANIVFTLDDSGSMHWEYMANDSLGSYYSYPRVASVYGAGDYTNYVAEFSSTIPWSVRSRSSAVNKVYYNPEVTYVPWSTDSGGSFGNASPSCALHNPQNPGLGCRNLTSNNSGWAYWVTWDGTTWSYNGTTRTFWPAVYYRFNGGNNWNPTDFTEVTISSVTPTYTGGANRTDCAAAPLCTYSEEIQNFANWYTYYRSRMLTARAGIGRAFARQGTNMRVGFAAINVGSNNIDGVTSNTALVRGVRPFSGGDRAQFFNDLYGHVVPPAGTPLRTAVQSVGEYYKRTDNRGPWGKLPGTNDGSAHLVCRQSYNILMTDGFWNGGSPGVANVDGTSGSTITGPGAQSFTYTPGPPYSDSHSNTLADTAMKYWVEDLRSTLSNEVPTNPADPAFWQHMVTFTVGLGVEGTLDTVADWPDIESGSTPWPNPVSGNEQHIDDLWHAAVNSRGGFFSASDPETFADSLSAVLSAISDRTASAASVALNTGSIASGSKVYQARFDSGDWSGQLLAYPINADGSLGSQVWDAATLMPNAGSRVIVTHDGINGQRFQWSDISAAQQSLLGSSDVLNYLRGVQTLELSNGGTFRNRTVLLGDLVHSAPTFVGITNFFYPDDWGASGVNEPEDSSLYSSYIASQKAMNSGAGRDPIVYISGNDGMLHAFNADTGVEEFAYVPNELYADLQDLSDPNYTHKFLADGSPSVVDAFIGGSWKTVLVSGLRAGGQGMFALDVTDPDDFNSEASGKSKVLWEFTDNDANLTSSTNTNFDADLGYTFGQPSIVRLQNGKWGAIFGNGYNNTEDNDGDGASNDSTTGNAVLYIADLETGQLIKKIDTGEGSVNDPSGGGRPNGLSEPAAVDADGDSIVDYVYAGDLFGNLWKFDLTASSASSWSVAYSQPLFTACAGTACNSSNYQAITSRPQVGRHPTSGFMVYFGTGKYIETSDNSTTGQTDQTFYAIWDENLSTLSSFGRSSLLEQKITHEVSQFGFDLRATSENVVSWSTHKGWYIDLYNQEGGASNNYGERQVSNSVLRNDRIIFTTLIPDDDPCGFGGTGWLMELDAYSGAQLPYSPFDLDGDGDFDSDDYINVGDIDGDGNDDYMPASGKKSTVGIIPTPGIVTSADGETEYKYESGSTGTIEITVENPGGGSYGRKSWRYLEN